MNKVDLKSYVNISILIIAFAAITGCVESLTDNQQSANPTIEIAKPLTGDTVVVGKNVISYQAADGVGGQGLSFYEVYVNTKFAGRFVQNTDGTNPEIFITVDSTLINSKISYSVKVYNKTGKAKESKLQENIFVRDKVPNSPTNLILTKLNDFAVNLLWDDKAANEKGYELWRKDGGSGTYRKIKTLPPNTISTDDSGISAFTDYFYKVRAYNDSGPSEFSNEVSTSSIPGGPWNLTAEAIGSSSIVLKWVDFAVNELGFIIERTDPFTGNFKRIAIVARNTETFVDTDVQPSTGYRYRVAYYTSTATSGYSNEVSISTYYTDIAAPSNLTASIGSNFVLLKWTDNSVVEKGTVIERKTGTTGNFVEYYTVASDITEAYDYNITKGQTYFYRVRQTLGTRTYTPYSNEVKVIIPN